jgi:hypothetical protein
VKYRRIILVALAVLAGLLLLFIAAANVILSTGLLRSAVDNGPDRTWISYRSARSLWPGRARVTNFKIRDRDQSAEWIFELDEARVTYSVIGLLRKRFHVTEVRGRGLTFRARNRLAKDAATPERLALLPPIFGFPDPPLLKSGEAKPPRTGKEWTIHVEKISVDPVREIWVDSWRYNGEGKATGGFLLQPKLRAEVFPSALELRGGALRSGKDEVAGEIRGALGCVVHPWQTREYPGSKMLRFIKGEGSVKGEIRSASLVNRLIGDLPGTRLEKARGNATVKAALDRGIASGEVGLVAPDAVLRALDVRLRGKLDLAVRIARLDIGKGGVQLSGGHVKLTGATITEEGKTHPWWAYVNVQEGKSQPDSPALLKSRLTVRAKDARPLLLLLNAKLPEWARNLLTMEGLTASANVRFGKSSIEIRRLDASGGKARIQGDYRAKGAAKRGTFLIDAGALAVGVGVDGGKTELRILGPKKWFEERTGREPAED